ncbi:hypothetical protein GCM10008957_33070 [Deinococcus ruber]|uniref:Uncharacterized protein n=1 Tax=Deinococcus ruber TaxID=1848197 RepID=A0A918CDP0_9DEIO|nr:hypothetical protein GCM10008957_33070 [Deinococcus ruber]
MIHGLTSPLIWDALEHTGNSDTNARMRLIIQLLNVFPPLAGVAWLPTENSSVQSDATSCGIAAPSGLCASRKTPGWTASELWSMECTFSSLKSSGFDLERTGMFDPEGLERLFGFVVLA